MLPSLFSTMTPSTPYQWLFMVYCYVLPVKAAVRRAAGIAAGDEVTVSLELA